MDIHIDISRIYFKINEVGDLFTGGNQLLISFHHRLVKVRMAHITSIDKEILMCTFLAGSLRLSYVSGDFHHRSIHLYIQQLLIKLFTENSHDTLAQRRYGKIEKFGIITIKREGNFRMNESDPFKFSKDIAQFGGISFQKLTPGRHIKEQILYREIASFRTGNSFLTLHCRARYHQLCP